MNNFFKNTVTLGLLFFAVSSAAVVSGGKEFISAENVISQDEAVISVQRSLIRKKFEPVSLVTNQTQYIVQPTEVSYQTAEAIITMVGKSLDNRVEYANVRVAIIYNTETNSYSAGEVSVKYTNSRKRL
ncbi:MAG: hypothetical protein HRT35_17480 [Algicola sp.]|nr:hypothetical protein [Algicola sp.]